MSAVVPVERSKSRIAWAAEFEVPRPLPAVESASYAQTIPIKHLTRWSSVFSRSALDPMACCSGRLFMVEWQRLFVRYSNGDMTAYGSWD